MTILPKPIIKSRKPCEKTSQNIEKSIGCHPLTAGMLVNRNILSLGDIKSFFSKDLSVITPPWKLKDIEKACIRILKAVKQNERIVIFGDYDTDGVTSASLVFLFLKPYVKNLSVYIPHREKEGYGLSEQHIDIFKAQNINLIITVDCGSSDSAAINRAYRQNIDVIVTDHHKIPDIPDKASAVVNPHRNDCLSGLSHLAGVGVAFYLVIQLRKTFREHGFFINKKEPALSEFLDLVALGTVADVVPMIKENRILTKIGFRTWA